MRDEKFADILKSGLERLGYTVAKESSYNLIILKDGDLMVELNTGSMDRVILNENLYNSEKQTLLKTINDLDYVYKCYSNEKNTLGENGSVYHKKLCEFNDTVLAVGLYSDNVFEYATWNIDRQNNSYFSGKYFMDYDMAKEDFAKRSEIINENKLFNDNELKIIKDTLQEFVDKDIDLEISVEQINDIFEVIEKVEAVLPNTEVEQGKNERQSVSISNVDYGLEMNI